jgi:alcohol dehydrogenase class IV
MESDPEVFSGYGALSHADTIITSAKSILLVTGGNSYEASGARWVLDKMLVGKQVLKVSFSGVTLSVDDVDLRYSTVRERWMPDLCVAIGGGTIIDLAKILALALSSKCKRIRDMIGQPHIESQIPVLAVPTTVGSGSEATQFCTMFCDGLKYSLDYPSLRPSWIILDSSLVESLSGLSMVSSILDAVTHAVESIMSVSGNETSRDMAQSALQILIPAVSGGDMRGHLSALQKGSYLAGCAINRSRTCFAHSLGYGLTWRYKIPHGVSVFLPLPEITRFNLSWRPGISVMRIDEEAWSCRVKTLEEGFGVSEPDAIPFMLDRLFDYTGQSSRLRDYGVMRNDLDIIASEGVQYSRSKNNPRVISQAEALGLLERIW